MDNEAQLRKNANHASKSCIFGRNVIEVSHEFVVVKLRSDETLSSENI